VNDLSEAFWARKSWPLLTEFLDDMDDLFMIDGEKSADNELKARYLTRLGFSQDEIDALNSTHATLAFLTDLHNRHILNIPFENLDQHSHPPASSWPAVPYSWPTPPEENLKDVRIFVKKLVSPAGRGGFCFELNLAFNWLLKLLGFDAWTTIAQIYRPEDGFKGLPPTHAINMVTIPNQGIFLVDVGFGDGPRTVVPVLNTDTIPSSIEASHLSNELAKDRVKDEYKVTLLDTPETLSQLLVNGAPFSLEGDIHATLLPLVVLRRRVTTFPRVADWTPDLDISRDSFSGMYRFGLCRMEADCEQFKFGLNYVLDPEIGTFFVQRRVCVRGLENGHLTLCENRVKQVILGEVTEFFFSKESREEEWRVALRDRFGVTIGA
jgi:arylamine N-acetyltransferase